MSCLLTILQKIYMYWFQNWIFFHVFRMHQWLEMFYNKICPIKIYSFIKFYINITNTYIYVLLYIIHAKNQILNLRMYKFLIRNQFYLKKYPCRGWGKYWQNGNIYIYIYSCPKYEEWELIDKPLVALSSSSFNTIQITHSFCTLCKFTGGYWRNQQHAFRSNTRLYSTLFCGRLIRR